MRSGNLLKYLTVAAVLAALLLVPLAVLYSQGLAGSASSLGQVIGAALREVSLLPKDEADLEPVTLLLYGIDAGEWVGGSYRPGPGRADTIVLVKVYPALKAAVLLSIPRDTLVVIPGRSGDDKINHAYAFGQTPLLVETVERFTGVEVDYYVGLNYLAFKEIVELLGGVEFYLDKQFRFGGRVLNPGLQMLDGDAAFAVVSNRQDPMGDISRVLRQQRFIQTVGSEAESRPLEDLFYILLAAWKNVDTNLDLLEALRLTQALKGIEEENVYPALVPGWFYNRAGISYWRPYPEETAAVLEQLFVNFERSTPDPDED